jgi:hypothetical protein
MAGSAQPSILWCFDLGGNGTRFGADPEAKRGAKNSGRISTGRSYSQLYRFTVLSLVTLKCSHGFSDG